MSAQRDYIARMHEEQRLTADELLHLSIPDKRVELVKGVLVVREPPGERHGEVTAALAHALYDYVKPRELGRVLTGDSGFRIQSDPDTVRAPDIAFRRRELIAGPAVAGYPEAAPDLAIEVLSPGDRPGEVLAKVADWLNAGATLVWVVDPERRQVRVYRAEGSESVIGEDGALDGEDVLPGFRHPVNGVF